MKKCIIYGSVLFIDLLAYYADLIAYYEEQGQYTVLGFTSEIYREYWGKYSYIMEMDYSVDYFIVIASGKMFVSYKNKLLAEGVPEYKIIPCIALACRDFNALKYSNIVKNKPSIFSNLCWGGFTYNSLGLEFTSPMINMFESAKDYLKIIGRLKYYMEQEIILYDFGWDNNQNKKYPIGKMDDVLLHFNHYETIESAVACWERRKKRINWDNLLFVMCTEDLRCAEEFSRLSYLRKICFVPFESDLDSVVPIRIPEEQVGNQPFYSIVNAMGAGNIEYYNVLDLLNEGKLTLFDSEIW